VIQYRIPRVYFLDVESDDMETNSGVIADNCFLQEFNKAPQEILMNSEYEYIEVCQFILMHFSILSRCISPFANFLRIIFENLINRLIPGGRLIILDNPGARKGLHFLNKTSHIKNFILQQEELATTSKVYKAISLSDQAISTRVESYESLKR